MSSPDPSPEITELLNRAASGHADSTNALLPMVYDQLRAVAQQRMISERAGHTLQATALVHEAYLRLIGPRRIPGRIRPNSTLQLARRCVGS